MTTEYPEGFDLNAAIAHQQLGNKFELEEAMGLRDPHTGRFRQHSVYGGDLGLNVKFSVVPVFSPKETFLANGVKKFVDQEFITITIPGDRNTEIHEQVGEFYKWRFPQEYAQFKKGQGAALIGTPLDMWPAMSPSQIEELKYEGIRTVEQVAALSDSSSGVLRNFYNLKLKAQQYLTDMGDKNAAAAVRVQMEAQDARHKAELKAMEDRIMSLMASAKEAKKTKGNETGKE